MFIGLGNIGLVGSARRRGGSYSPVTDSKVLAFWDAEAATTITLVSSKVSAWADRKNGHAVAQAVDASRPQWSATSFNGRPGITPDGVDDFLEAASTFNFPVGSEGGEIWALFEQTVAVADSTATLAIVGYGGNVQTSARRLVRIVNSGVNRGRYIIGIGASATNTENTQVDFSGRHVIRGISTPTEGRLRVDGLADVSPVAAVPATGAALTRFFASNNAPASQFGKGVCNAVAVAQLMSDDEATLLRNYLFNRGGIS